jgi:hypothetical protein
MMMEFQTNPSHKTTFSSGTALADNEGISATMRQKEELKNALPMAVRRKA